MQIQTVKSRSVRWCYDNELAARDQRNDLVMLTTGMFPYLLHKGKLILDENDITLIDNRDEAIEKINFSQIETVYLGYDELYPRRLSKNFGTFWSPLRLTMKDHSQIYLIIFDRLGLLVKNRYWFETLKESLSR